uniref:Uncharacterized protein n=1 Tax=Zea mays TaxID=4577 RepID=B6U2P2_MAIZE|nr:hypothetical protein [Zea mays]
MVRLGIAVPRMLANGYTSMSSIGPCSGQFSSILVDGCASSSQPRTTTRRQTIMFGKEKLGHDAILALVLCGIKH